MIQLFNVLPSDSALQKVEPVRLKAGLDHAFEIEIVDQTGSTNTDLLMRFRHSVYQRPVVRIAYHQTAGRGRSSQPWIDTIGDTLLFSMAYSMPGAVDRLAGLSLAVGTAILAGLRTFPLTGSDRLGLKWPNDILLDQNKLAGVLIEASQSMRAETIVIIGIGLNLHQDRTKTHDDAGALPLAALEQVLVQWDKTEILIRLLNTLVCMLDVFKVQGLAPFLAPWNADHVYADRCVTVFEEKQAIEQGRILGIDALGRLCIETSSGPKTFTSGEVSLTRTDQGPLKLNKKEL